MAINPSIALGVRPMRIEQQDPNAGMNALARMMQVGSLMEESDARRRALSESNALNDAYKGALGSDGAVDRNALFRTMAERNLGSKIPGVQKQFMEYDTAASTLEKTRGETADKAISRYRDQLSFVTTPQQAVQWIQAQHADPIVGKIVGRMGPIEQAIASIPQDPAGFAQWRQENALGMTKFVEMNKPTLQKIDSGQVETLYSIPGMGGAPKVVTSVQKLQTPDNKASVGAQYAIAQSNRDAANTNAQAIRDAASIKDRRDTEMKLADDYRTESKGFAETSTAMKKVLGAIDTADKNPGAALAAGTAFMKLLDPNSVVRETELGMALNASGWFDRATNIANTLQNGRIMTAEQQKNLRAAATQLFEDAKKAQREVDASYKNRANGYGLDAGRIITDRGQNGASRSVVRTGTLNGRRVVELSDGTVDYAD